MNFEHLNLVLQIEECSSLSDAARKLFISQPTVSKMLKSIEDELGFTLFVRSKAGVTPTLSGRIFLDYARDTLERLRNLKANCASNLEAGEHMLRVVTNGTDFLREAYLRTVTALSTDTDIFQYSVANLTDCYSAISGANYELGILFFPSVFENAVSEYLAAGELVADVLGYLPVSITVDRNSLLGGSDGKQVSVSSLSSFRVSYPYEGNGFFSNILWESSKLFGCAKEMYSPRLYGDEEYLRVSASSVIPDPYNLQMYAYSDWIRNIYNPDEFRFQPDTRGPMKKLGLERDTFPNLKILSLEDVPFRTTILEFHKKIHRISRIEGEYIRLLRSLLNEEETGGE